MKTKFYDGKLGSEHFMFEIDNNDYVHEETPYPTKGDIITYKGEAYKVICCSFYYTDQTEQGDRDEFAVMCRPYNEVYDE